MSYAKEWDSGPPLADPPPADRFVAWHAPAGGFVVVVRDDGTDRPPDGGLAGYAVPVEASADEVLAANGWRRVGLWDPLNADFERVAVERMRGPAVGAAP